MKIDKVRDYVKHLDRVKKLTKELEMLDTASDVVRSTSYADELAKVGVKAVTDKNGITRYMGKNGKFLSHDEVLKRIDDLPKGAKSYTEELAEAGVNVTTDKNGIIRYRDKAGKYISHDEVMKRIDDLPNIRKQERTKEIEQLKETMEQMKKDDPNVKKYAEQADVFDEVYEYGKKLKGLRPQTGNVLTRGVKLVKGIHAARNGNKILAKGAKAARASKLSSRVKDWLFHSTLKNANTLRIGQRIRVSPQ
jgi:Fe2+ or Zn2+ uptake regulation protein